MTNEERIRKWREKRGEGLGPDEVLGATEAPQRVAPRAENQARPDPFGQSPSLDQARRNILDRRRQRWYVFLKRFGLFVALPLFIVFLYVELIATPLYQGEA